MTTVTQNKHFQKAMQRYGLADNTIVDYLYISNKMYLGQPSNRLQVSSGCASQTHSCTADFSEEKHQQNSGCRQAVLVR